MKLIPELMAIFEASKISVVYRGTQIPEKRIGDTAKMNAIFATTSKQYAEEYGNVVSAYAVDKNTKILDYNLSAKKSEARDLVKDYLVNNGRMSERIFENDPRNAMAMAFMIPSDFFIEYFKNLGFDAIWMNASNTTADEIIVLNTSKFKLIT